MKFELTLPVSSLRAALMCAAKKDVRYYLNGVYLDFPKSRIVSTDGHILFCGQIPAVETVSNLCPIIIPRDAIESAVKLSGKKGYDALLTVSDANGLPNVTIAVVGGTVAATAIDGRFPEYERVIPAKTSGMPGQYDPELLTICRDAINAYSGQKINGYFLHHNGEAAAIMHGPECLAVCMPTRAADIYSLDWFNPSLKAAA